MESDLGFRLMLITSGKPSERKILPLLIERACKAGIKAVQIREKDMKAREFDELVKRSKQITRKYKVKLIINTGNETKFKMKGDCLHYPSGTLPKRINRNKDNMIKGTSVHSVTQAKDAANSGYDYVLFGPVFRTPAKVKYGSPQGIKALKSVCNSVSIPVFAVGGITPERVEKCKNAGAYGVAVIRAILSSKNIRKTVMEFKKELGEL